jgi:hypothetical protein
MFNDDEGLVIAAGESGKAREQPSTFNVAWKAQTIFLIILRHIPV